jgi:hypothetical protein
MSWRFLTYDASFSICNNPRNRQTISRRPLDVIVDVTPASRADYYEAIATVSFADRSEVAVFSFSRSLRALVSHKLPFIIGISRSLDYSSNTYRNTILDRSYEPAV